MSHITSCFLKVVIFSSEANDVRKPNNSLLAHIQAESHLYVRISMVNGRKKNMHHKKQINILCYFGIIPDYLQLTKKSKYNSLSMFHSTCGLHSNSKRIFDYISYPLYSYGVYFRSTNTLYP